MKSITEGWVIVSGDGFIHDYTFDTFKSESIQNILSRGAFESWAAMKREGYRCVKSTRTIEIKEDE